MHRMKKIFIILLLLKLSLLTNIYAGTTATALDIAGNAYEKNLGYCGVASYNTIGAVSENPSVIANLKSLTGSLSYFNYIDDFKMFYGNFSYPALDTFNIFGRIGYLYMPSITDIETGAELGYRELFFGLGTGYLLLNNKLAIGGIVNFYSANIAAQKGSTIFFNLGANYSFNVPFALNDKIILGMSLLNLGPGITYNQEKSSLPSNFNLGLQYIHNNDYKLFTSLRNYSAYEGMFYSIGAEINIFKTIFFRGSVQEDINNTLKYNLGLGFDLIYSDYHFLIDYAFLPLESLEAASVITLSFKFPIPGQEIEKNDENWKNMWTTK